MIALAPLAALVIAGVAPADTSLLPDLPLVEARAAASRPTLAVLWSGDGNWAGFVQGLTRELNAKGISVVGLKSRAYLTGAPRKTPEAAGRDLARMLRAYLKAWSADSLLLIGYSRGADLLPFGISRLPEDLRSRVSLLGLISPAVNANFEFHLRDLISNPRRSSDLELLPEVRKLRGLRILCIYGVEDSSALCPVAEAGLLQPVARERGHRMDDPAGTADLLLEAIAKPR
jgi:type IV secretory pathway VirJ component